MEYPWITYGSEERIEVLRRVRLLINSTGIVSPWNRSTFWAIRVAGMRS